MSDSALTHPQAQLVPGDYAEKAMASLMRLHGELMDEKERRVELYRRLMEKEQALAELKMYVKLLEEKAAKGEKAQAPAARPEPPQPLRVIRSMPVRAVPKPPPPPRRPEAKLPRRPEPKRTAPDGWKAW